MFISLTGYTASKLPMIFLSRTRPKCTRTRNAKHPDPKISNLPPYPIISSILNMNRRDIVSLPDLTADAVARNLGPTLALPQLPEECTQQASTGLEETAVRFFRPW